MTKSALFVVKAGAALAATVFPGPLFAQARTAETVLMSENAEHRRSQEAYGYADAVIAGDLVFLSGIVAAKGPDETSLEPAYDRVFRQIGAILTRAGAGYRDIVEITSFHSDITSEIDALSAVQKRYLGSPPPAWTAIDVDRLLPDGGLTEIKIVARRTAAPAPN